MEKHEHYDLLFSLYGIPFMTASIWCTVLWEKGCFLRHKRFLKTTDSFLNTRKKDILTRTPHPQQPYAVAGSSLICQ